MKACFYFLRLPRTTLRLELLFHLLLWSYVCELTNKDVVMNTSQIEQLASEEEFKQLARLKKAISYVGAMLDSTDPELIPLGKWDELNPQVSACSNEVLAYSANRNIVHLQQANDYADGILSISKPLVAASGRSAPTARA